MSGKIVVIGAAGNVGAPLVAELVKRGEKVKGASRSASARFPAPTVRFDLADPSTLAPALEGVDRIYALSPAGSVDPVTPLKPIIEAAAKRGIKVVLQTAIGVDADDNIPFRQLELLLERSGAPFVILRPNWFSDNFATYWAGGVQAGGIRVPAGEGKTSFVDTRDIAAAAAGALTSDRHNGKAFVLTGPAAHSYAEAAELLSSSLGRRIGYTPVDSETFIAEAIAAGVPADYAGVLAMILHPSPRAGWPPPPTRSRRCPASRRAR